jgi:hypothetical protein
MAKLVLNVDEDVKNLYTRMAEIDGKTLSGELEKLMADRFSDEDLIQAQKRRMANKIIKN